MGSAGSVNLGAQTDETIVESLIPLYEKDQERFQNLWCKIKTAKGSKRPLFPLGIKVCDIKKIPEGEVESFKEKHLSNQYFQLDSEEGKRRNKSVREIQYKRWHWATENIASYINMLRLSGHSDEAIQAMLDGRPLCFASQETFYNLREALKELAPKIEVEMGWNNVSFIMTGSSVPGFSQNPCKGFADLPSKITCPQKSDVDLCIIADGVGRTIAAARSSSEASEPRKMYTTTCSPLNSGLRFGCKDISQFCSCVADFYKEWSEKLPGGLQLTFAEYENNIPPWEAYIV